MKYSTDSSGLLFTFRSVPLRLTLCGEGVWRLQSGKNGIFDDSGAAQVLARDLGEKIPSSPEVPSFTCSDEELKAVSPDGSSVRITGKAITFSGSDGVARETIVSVSTDEKKSTVSLLLPDGRSIYGTGERFDSVNRRGKKVNIYAIDQWCRTVGNSYVPIPFTVSSDCTGVFMNRYEHSVFDIGKTKKSRYRIIQKYAPVDLYIFISSSVSGVIRSYSEITGFAPMPAPWLFGTQVCRYHPEFHTKQGVLAMADSMEKNDFPWDAVILEGWGAYDKTRWDELKEISSIIHAKGKKVMVYEQCGRFPKRCEKFFGLTDEHAVQSAKGVLLKETRSMNLLDNFHHKKMRCVDLTDPAAVAKWEEIWGTMVNDIDIDGAKIDFCEQFPDSEKAGIRFRDGRPSAGAHHWYPVYYNILRHKHFNTKPDGGMNFSRGGGIGAQRYPFIWAGDQRREFYFLRPVISAALSLGLSGVPFTSWDMAGYQPSFNPRDKKYESKVFIRGLEFTAFSPNIQTHGRVTRPYDFDDHTKDVYRAYAKLHDLLRPYLLEQARIACDKGTPLMRHLSIYDSSDRSCLGCEDEYMLGDSLLVAPVLHFKDRRSIYLPKGKWVNIFSGKEYDGGCALKNVSIAPEEIPVFRLKGSASQIIDKVLDDCSEQIKIINSLKGNN